MTVEDLKQQHDSITDQYYVQKTLAKTEFDRLHSINSLKLMLLAENSGYYTGITDEEIQTRIDELEAQS